MLKNYETYKTVVKGGLHTSNFTIVDSEEAKKTPDPHICLTLQVCGKAVVDDINIRGDGSVIVTDGQVNNVTVSKGTLSVSHGGTATHVTENGGSVRWDKENSSVSFNHSIALGFTFDSGSFTIHHKTVFDHCEILTDGQVCSGGILRNSNVGSNGDVAVLTNGIIKDVVITDGGFVRATEKHAIVRGIIVSSGGAIALGQNTLFSDITIADGGYVYVPEYMKEKCKPYLNMEDGSKMGTILDADPEDPNTVTLGSFQELRLGDAPDDQNLDQDYVLTLMGYSETGLFTDKQITDSDMPIGVKFIVVKILGSDYSLHFETSQLTYDSTSGYTVIRLHNLSLTANNKEALPIGAIHAHDYINGIVYTSSSTLLDVFHFELQKILLDGKPMHVNIERAIHSLSIKAKAHIGYNWLRSMSLKYRKSDKDKYICLQIEIKSAIFTHDANARELDIEIFNWGIWCPDDGEEYSRDCLLEKDCIISGFWFEPDTPDGYQIDIQSVWYRGHKVAGPPYCSYHIIRRIPDKDPEKCIGVFDPNVHKELEDRTCFSDDLEQEQASPKHKENEYKKIMTCDIFPISDVQVRAISEKEILEQKFEDQSDSKSFLPGAYCTDLLIKGSTASNVVVLDGGFVGLYEGYVDNIWVYPGGRVTIFSKNCYGNIFEEGGYIDFDGDEKNTVNGNLCCHRVLDGVLATVHKGTRFYHLTIKNGTTLYIRGEVEGLETIKNDTKSNTVEIFEGGILKNSGSIYKGTTIEAYSGSHIEYSGVAKGGVLVLYKGARVKHVEIWSGGVLMVEKQVDQNAEWFKKEIFFHLGSKIETFDMHANDFLYKD